MTSKCGVPKGRSAGRPDGPACEITGAPCRARDERDDRACDEPEQHRQLGEAAPQHPEEEHGEADGHEREDDAAGRRNPEYRAAR